MNEVTEAINIPVGDVVIVKEGTYISIIGVFLANLEYKPVNSPRVFKLSQRARGQVLNPDEIWNLPSGCVAVGVSQPPSTTVISLSGDTQVTHI